MSSLTMREFGHICVRSVDNKQLLGLTLPQYTTHEKHD